MQGLGKFITVDEGFAALQHIRKINVEAFDYLNQTQNKELSKDMIDHCISIYDDLSGSFEKYVRSLVFISKTIEGLKPDYTQIKKDKLANHVGYLKKRPIFKDLIESFNVTIRNAIAHKDVLVNPLSKSIVFINTKETIERSYEQFLNETREFAAAWSVVSKIGFAIILYYARNFDLYYKVMFG
jgi:hypothetical protein